MLLKKRKPVTSSGQSLKKKLFGLQEEARKSRVKQNHRKRTYRNLIIPVMCKFAVDRYDFFLLFKTITFNCKNNCLFYINKNLIFKLLISTFYTYLRNIGLLRKTIRYLHFHFECASLQRV